MCGAAWTPPYFARSGLDQGEATRRWERWVRRATQTRGAGRHRVGGGAPGATRGSSSPRWTSTRRPLRRRPHRGRGRLQLDEPAAGSGRARHHRRRTTFEALLASAGISNDDTIVLYGDNNNWFAAYAFWVLQMYGHKTQADGRRPQEVGRREPPADEGRAVARAATYKAQEPHKRSARAATTCSARSATTENALVDVRSPAEYNGEIMAPPGYPPETAQRMGHIPGAASVPWAQAVTKTAPSSRPRS